MNNGQNIGNVENLNGSKIFQFKQESHNKKLSLKNHGYDMTELKLGIERLKVGTKFEIIDTLESNSIYAPSTKFSLTCPSKYIKISKDGTKYTLEGNNQGNSSLVVETEKGIVMDIEFTIHYPKIEGVPDIWIYDRVVYIPNNLSIKNEENFERVGERIEMNTVGWRMKKFQPIIQLMRNGMEIGVISHVVFYKNPYPMPENRFYSDNHILEIPLKTNLRAGTFAWFDNDSNQVTEIDLITPRIIELYLMVQDENYTWHKVNGTHSVYKSFFEILDWDLMSSLEKHIKITEEWYQGRIYKYVKVDKKIMSMIPKRYSFDDFLVKVSDPAGFELSRHIDGFGNLDLSINCNTDSGYETKLKISLNSHEHSVTIPIYFSEEYDISFDDDEIFSLKCIFEDDDLVLIEIAHSNPEEFPSELIDFRLWNQDELISEFSFSRDSNNPFRQYFPQKKTVKSDQYHIELITHPFGRTLGQLQLNPTIKQIDRKWLTKYYNYENLNFHPRLQQRMNQRIVKETVKCDESIESHVITAGSKLIIDNIENPLFKPILLIYIEERAVVARLHPKQTYSEEGFGDGCFLGFDENLLPLIIKNEELNDGEPFLKGNNEVTFNKPGIYIIALMIKIPGTTTNTYFGTDDKNEWANRYTKFIEIEVI